MHVNNIFYGIQGFLWGGGSVYSYRNLASVEQGDTDYTGWMQGNKLRRVIGESLYFLNEAKQIDMPRHKRRWIARLVGYSIPLAIQMLNHRIDGKQNPTIKKIVMAARHHVQHVAFAVDILVTAYFAYMLTPIFAAGAVIGFAIEMAQENNLMSPKVQAVWEKFRIGLCLAYAANAVFVTDWDLWDLSHMVINLLIYVWEHYLENTEPRNPSIHLLDEVKAKQILRNPEKLKVNLSHLIEDPKLGSDVNLDIIETMNSLLEKVEYSRANFDNLKQKFLADPVFNKDFPAIVSKDDLSDDLAKQELLSKGKSLATQIAHSAIKKGNSDIQYNILQPMLKKVLQAFQKDKIFDHETFFEMVVRSGDPCGTGMVDGINYAFKIKVLGKNGKIDLRMKILQQFINTRERWFNKAYHGFLAPKLRKLPVGLVQADDVHFIGIAQYYFDKPIRLHSVTVENDMAVQNSPFCDNTYRFLLSLFMKFTFWQYAKRPNKPYNVELLTQEIVDATMELGLGNDEITDWWKIWAEDKEELADELAMQGTLFGKSLTVPSGRGTTQKANPILVKLMLYDMGILCL